MEYRRYEKVLHPHAVSDETRKWRKALIVKAYKRLEENLKDRREFVARYPNTKYPLKWVWSECVCQATEHIHHWQHWTD